jgi:hypothetical protein
LLCFLQICLLWGCLCQVFLQRAKFTYNAWMDYGLYGLWFDLFFLICLWSCWLNCLGTSTFRSVYITDFL